MGSQLEPEILKVKRKMNKKKGRNKKKVDFIQERHEKKRIFSQIMHCKEGYIQMII